MDSYPSEVRHELTEHNQNNGKSKIKLCIIANFYPYYGFGLERVIKGIVNCLEPEKFDTCVFYRRLSRKIKQSQENTNNNTRIIPSIDIPLPIVGELVYGMIVGLRIGRANFDVVHANGANGFGFAIFSKFSRNKTKLICAFHGISWCSLDCYIKKYGFPKGTIISLLRRIASFMESYSARHCDMVVAVSEGVKKELVTHYHVDEKKILVIRNGVDSETFKPSDRAASFSKLRLSPQFKYALYVGKYHHRKGLDIAVRAIQILNEPNLKLLVVGPEPDLVRRLYRDDFIVSLGRISDEELIHVYNVANFLIHPSRYEGHPVTVLEALACGLPVLASKQSKAEIISDGSEGFVIDNGEDASRYAERMRMFLDENLRIQMSQNSRKLAQSVSELKQYDKYKQLYLTINN